MREAVIVSTARTPIGRAYRGAFNDTQAQELAAHALSHAVQRTGLEGGEVLVEHKPSIYMPMLQSDGAPAPVLMESKEAERRGLEPLGVYSGMTVAGCGPDERGIGPVFAIPKLLKQHNLTIDDIGLWGLFEVA
ncbi:thiolase family protein [Streptomyces sp. NPDC002676]